MFRRAVSLALCVALLPQLACSVWSTEKLSPARYAPGRGLLVGVTTKAGDEVRFDEAARVRSDTVFAQVQGQGATYPLADLSELWVQVRDQGKAATRSFGILAGMAVLGLAVGAVLKTL